MEVISFFLLALPALVAGSDACSSFSVNSSHAYFDYYRFYDFRNLTSSTSSRAESESSLPTSLIVNDTSWTRDWTIREQNRSAPTDDTISMRYARDNVFLADGVLNFVTRRENAALQSTAELDYTAVNITHASMRVRARVTGDPGAVAGIFTYYNDTQESDFELLTIDLPGRAHFSNQPTTDDDGDTITGSTFNVSAPDYTTWNVYRLDWLPGHTIWYINGKEMKRTNVHVPVEQSMFIMNLWSNGGRFSGSMQEGGSASMQVEWVEMVFNRVGSDSTSKRHDGQTCSVDMSVGSPVPVSGAVGILAVRSGFLVVLCGMLAMIPSIIL